MGENSLDHPDVANLIRESLRAERLSQLWSEVTVTKEEGVGETWCGWFRRWIKGPHANKCGHLLEAIKSKKMDSLLESRKECSPEATLILIQ